MGGQVMQKFFGFAVLFFTIMSCISRAEAIDVYFAEVHNGGAFVQGDKAAAYSTITWEGQTIGAANRFGGFRFLAARGENGFAKYLSKAQRIASVRIITD
jgi:hypothetical protein